MIKGFITTVDKRKDYFLPLTEKSLELNEVETIKISNLGMLERYKIAEETYSDNLYVFSDDDVVISDKGVISDMVSIMNINTDIGILGLSWKKDLTKEEMGVWCLGEISKYVLEMDHVGGIMIIRKGSIHPDAWKEECDYSKGIGDDKVVCRNVRKNGYKVGLYTNAYFHHLGAGKSTCW